MIKKFILFIFSILLICSCQKERTPMEMIMGKWRAEKWLVGGEKTTGFDVSIINFEFKKDSFYKANMGRQSETGTFNLRNNCFNAHSIYGVDKRCPILRLEKDTMVWMMDSVHQPGNLYLVRVKE